MVRRRQRVCSRAQRSVTWRSASAYAKASQFRGFLFSWEVRRMARKRWAFARSLGEADRLYPMFQLLQPLRRGLYTQPYGSVHAVPTHSLVRACLVLLRCLRLTAFVEPMLEALCVPPWARSHVAVRWRDRESLRLDRPVEKAMADPKSLREFDRRQHDSG
jgi:hypothetical protein